MRNNAQNNAHEQKMSPMYTQKPRNIGLFECLLLAYTGNVYAQRGKAFAGLQECPDMIGHSCNIHFFHFFLFLDYSTNPDLLR